MVEDRSILSSERLYPTADSEIEIPTVDRIRRLVEEKWEGFGAPRGQEFHRKTNRVN
jgi:hypothetical protein